MPAKKSVDRFPEGHLESLARALGDAVKGKQIGNVFENLGIDDASGESTKWKRLHWAFLHTQRQHGVGNGVLKLVKELLTPGRFRGSAADFERYRADVNVVLAISGLEYGPDGNFRRRGAAKTLDEAERRADSLQEKFAARVLHPEVEKYCRAELLQENYFHAVFEAAKGLLERVRDMSGLTKDGMKLVDEAFSIKHPLLAFNDLETEREQSEHKGIVQLIKGCVGVARNPQAHGPKILSDTDDDTADYLALISFLHRKLDGAFRTAYSIKQPE